MFLLCWLDFQHFASDVMFVSKIAIFIEISIKTVLICSENGLSFFPQDPAPYSHLLLYMNLYVK